MTDQSSTLSLIRSSLECWQGAAADAVEFRHAPDDENVPTEMSILFFDPGPLPNDDDVSLVATAGMSTRPMRSTRFDRVELALEIKGTIAQKERPIIAKQLAELAVIPFREGRAFTPNLILDNFRLHPFESMPCALLVHWELTTELYLASLAPRVLLLKIIPLFTAEAELAENGGDIRAVSQFRSQGMKYEDFQRESVIDKAEVNP